MEWNNGRASRAAITGRCWKRSRTITTLIMNAPVRTISPGKAEPDPVRHQGRRSHASTCQGRNGRESTFETAFEGVIPNLERRYRETNSEYIRNKISEYMTDRPCPTCKGNRLRPEALAVTVDNANIVEVTAWPVNRTLEWVEELAGRDLPLNPRQQAIAERILKEISSRLGFLVNVGLDYLTLQPLGGHRSPAARRSASAWRPRSARA